MTDKILRVSDSKIYYAVTKIWIGNKRAKINRIALNTLKPPTYTAIIKDYLQEQVAK